MTAQQAATALAAAVETTGHCIRRPTSRWSSCKCPKCRALHQRIRKLAIAGIINDKHRDLAEARLRAWVQEGWQPTAIASAVGVSPGTMQTILKSRQAGRPTRLNHATASAVLKAGRPTKGRADASGTRRRLQALAWNGWTLEAIHEHTGLPMMTLSDLRSRSGQLVRVDTRNTIADVYEELEDRLGGSGRSAYIARQRDWAPPAAWDEDTIDVPGAEPSGVAGPAGGDNPFRPLDSQILKEVAELHRLGHSDADIARRLRRSPSAIQKLRSRHDIRRAS